MHDPNELDAEPDPGTLGAAARRLEAMGGAFAAGLPTQAARARVRARMFEEDARPFQLGRYVVLGVLGQGGMGIVYAAYDPELDRKVALKLLHHDTSSEARARLKREARALAKLAHPNVLAVHDVGSVVVAGPGNEDERTRAYVAMELVDGVTLGAWRRAEHRAQREIVEIMFLAGRGLAAAHAAGIVHRDFKPDNVLVGRDGRPRVMDFGLARAEGEPTAPGDGRARDAKVDAITRSGAFVGTPAYMAPEQFLGLELDTRADQFAFCVALCEALCGERPFEGTSVHELAANVIAGKRRELPRDAAVPRWLQAVLDRGLSRDPAARFASMDALLAALADDPTRRRRVVLGVIAGVVVALVAIGLWQLARVRARADCAAAADAIAEQWNERAREQLSRAMAATGLPYATTSAAGASEWIDRRVTQWSRTRADVCVAELEHRMDDASAARAVECLATRRAEITGLVQRLLVAERPAVTRAVIGAARLPDPGRCRDPLVLARQPLVPDSTRADVTRIRDRLATTWAMIATASYGPALAEAELALAEAEDVDEPGTIASAELLVGRAAELSGDPQRASAALERAVYRAGAAGADETLAEAAELLVWVLGVQLGKHEQALAWGRHARMWHDRLRLADDDPHRVTLLVHTAMVQAERGDFAEAIAIGERALAIQERVLGADHPDVAIVLNNLGIAYSQLDDDAHAVEVWQRALDIRETALGPAHPDVAASLGNLALVAYSRGELDQAESLQRRALAIREAALGPEHLDTAVSWRNLGDIAVARGRAADALTDYARAAEIYERVGGPEHHDLGVTFNAIANTYEQLGDPTRAEQEFRRALPILEHALGAGHANVATVRANLAQVLVQLHRAEEALALAERARADLTVALGEQHVRLATALLVIGEAELALERPGRAVAPLERAVELREGTAVQASQLALARARLADALWRSGHDRLRARALAEQALAGFAGEGAALARARAETRRWLAAHERD